MNILLVDGQVLAEPLRQAGHNVLHYSPPESGIAYLPQILAKNEFTPDLILHAEHLARRLLLQGLSQIACPKFFWAIDSHLNLYWHRYYARLFDAVLTPHPSLWAELPPEWRHPRVHQFTKPGYARPFKPHKERAILLSLVGVLDSHRHLRLNLAALLKTYWGVEARQNIPFAEMLSLYDDSKIIPNESIAREVNYRLMESASCGAVPLTQDVGPDQDSLFERGREMLIYRDAAELVAHINALAADPVRAEAIGRAAWQRVQRDHLPANRVAMLEKLTHELSLELYPKAPKQPQNLINHTIQAKENLPLDCDQECALLWLCLVQMHRSWRLESRPDELIAQSIHLPDAPESVSYRLRLLAEYNAPQRVMPQLEQILSQNQHRASLDLNLAGSLIALRAGHHHLARQFLYRQQLYGNSKIVTGRRGTRPESAQDLCLAWADLLTKAGRKAQLGLTVNSASGIPECAWTTLLLGLHLLNSNPAQTPTSDEIIILKKIEALTSGVKGLEFYHLGYLAQLCLAEPDNWMLQMRYAEACLQTFRLEEGLAERKAAEAKRAFDGRLTLPLGEFTNGRN